MTAPTTPKLAVVTGGASGMGRIIAKRLASQGAKVAILDLNEKGLAETASASTNIQSFVCDISNEEMVNQVIADVTEQMGQIDRLVHAAALMPTCNLADQSAQEIVRLTQINYFGTIYMVKAVLPAMRERNAGEIVVFGSIAGHAFVPNMAAYCATKSAVNTYMECLINELGDTNLGIHLVKPPAVNTPLINQTMVRDTPQSILEAQKSGRLADPEKIVDAIEKGMAKGKKIIYPGEARFLQIWHTLAPGLWWKTVMSFEKKAAAAATETAKQH